MVGNLNKFYLSREKVNNFFKDYAEMITDEGCNAKHDETEGTGPKTLTSKQMLQILPIVLAQLKAGNNSITEIRHIVYYLYQLKQITKKVYNNIIKSIQ